MAACCILKLNYFDSACARMIIFSFFYEFIVCVFVYLRERIYCVCVYVNWEKIHSVLYICSTYIYKFIVYMWKLGEIEFNDRDFIVFVCIWERMHFVCVFKSYSSLCLCVCDNLRERNLVVYIYMHAGAFVWEFTLCSWETENSLCVKRQNPQCVFIGGR